MEFAAVAAPRVTREQIDGRRFATAPAGRRRSFYLDVGVLCRCHLAGRRWMSPAVEFHNLTLGYDRHPAVHHLRTQLDRGSLTAVVGPNGAGKSTLLKSISGVLQPLEGKISGAALRRDHIAYLPQQSEIDRTFPMSVRDLVGTGLWRELGPFGSIRRRHWVRIDDAIAAVGLTGFERRTVGSLSGGQMQRALFARLLLQDADLVLLDEPFTALDAKTAADLVRVVERWHGEGRTVVAVLHDLDTVREYFPDTLLLARELVAHGPTSQVLTSENLLRARQMCERFDHDANICGRSAA